MSHALELRRITTEERLRASHIETLEILQKTRDENIELRREIDLLRRTVEEEESKPTPSAESLAENVFVMQKLNEQDELIQELQLKYNTAVAEMKTMRATMAIKIREKEQENIKILDILNNLREKLSWSQEHMSIREEDWRSHYHLNSRISPKVITPVSTAADDNEKIKHRLHSLEVESDAYRRQIKELIADNQQLKDSLDALNKKCQEMETTHHLAIKLAVDSEGKVWKDRVDKLQRQTDDLKGLCEAKEKELASLRLVNSSLQSQLEALMQQTTLPTGSHDAMMVDDHAEDNSSICSLQRPTDSEANEDFSFGEFVRLKRENKTLKLQIALLRDGERDVEDARRSSTRKTSKVMSVTKSSTGFETKLSNSSRARR